MWYDFGMTTTGHTDQQLNTHSPADCDCACHEANDGYLSPNTVCTVCGYVVGQVGTCLQCAGDVNLADELGHVCDDEVAECGWCGAPLGSPSGHDCTENNEER
jgi:hypothetical protein